VEEPRETQKQRHDRELIELLNELRVALPGVQVLFAFLLAVPFSTRFGKVTDFEKRAFFVALVATAVSSALLIATPSFHRLRFRVEDKGRIVQLGNKLAIAGFLALAVAMLAAVLMVATFLYDKTVGIATASSIAVVILVLWYGLALRAYVTDRARPSR
jgi:predicted MFS family arabinose efflux permease